MKNMLQQKPMSLREYLCESYEPNWRLGEDEDYVIFHDDYYSGLSILIDKDAFFVERKDRIHYFDILRMVYELPYLACKARFGNFFEGKHGLSFFLTEPKNADDILIYNYFDSTYLSLEAFYGEGRKYIKHETPKAIVTGVGEWTKLITANDDALRSFCDSAIKSSQKEYETALSRFYSIK